MHTPQKETPVGGGNHTAGVNTHETSAIVHSDMPPVKPTADTYVRELAQANTQRLLNKAALFAETYAPKAIWHRRMGSGAAQVLVRLEWPGVLAVYDPKTGGVLARSLPGQPTTLEKQ